MITICRIINWTNNQLHSRHLCCHEFFHSVSISASIKAVKHHCLYLNHISHRNFSGCWKAPCEHQRRTFALLQGLFHFGNIYFHPQGKTVFSCVQLLASGTSCFSQWKVHRSLPQTIHALSLKSLWISEWQSKPCPAVSFIHVLASRAKPQPHLLEQLHTCNSNLFLLSH